MVHGLQSKPYWNDQAGTVLPSLSNDRYAVQLDLPCADPESGTINEEPISLKRSNIVETDINFADQLEQLGTIRFATRRLRETLSINAPNVEGRLIVRRNVK